MITVKSLCDNPAKIIYEGNLTTIGKKAKANWEPTEEWLLSQFIAEDSTLDRVLIEIYDTDIRSDVCAQIVRHKTYGTTHSVESHRPDWTGKPRDPTRRRALRSVFTVRAFIKMMHERLCGLAMQETQAWALSVRDVMLTSADSFVVALAKVCVPLCVAYGGCRKGSRSCGFKPQVVIKEVTW